MVFLSNEKVLSSQTQRTTGTGRWNAICNGRRRDRDKRWTKRLHYVRESELDWESMQDKGPESPLKRGERFKRNIGKMTQLAIEPPNGRHPLKSPNSGWTWKWSQLWAHHTSESGRGQGAWKGLGIDSMKVSVPEYNCSYHGYPCPQWRQYLLLVWVVNQSGSSSDISFTHTVAPLITQELI